MIRILILLSKMKIYSFLTRSLLYELFHTLSSVVDSKIKDFFSLWFLSIADIFLYQLPLNYNDAVGKFLCCCNFKRPPIEVMPHPCWIFLSLLNSRGKIFAFSTIPALSLFLLIQFIRDTDSVVCCSGIFFSIEVTNLAGLLICIFFSI